MTNRSSHKLWLSYSLWIFGFTGSHRFYTGRPVTGTIWFFSFGLLGIGWLIDFFLMPSLVRSADRRYKEGRNSYTVAWLLQTFFGILGLHRFYLGKWVTGLVWLCTGGLFVAGYLYDFWTLNEQVDEQNS